MNNDKCENSVLEQHKTIQVEKLMNLQLQNLEGEYTFLKHILNDLCDRANEDGCGNKSIIKGLECYSEYRNFQERLIVHEQLDINAMLKNLCDSVHSDFVDAGIELYVGALPKLTGDKKAAHALFASLYNYIIFDVADAHVVHIDFEATKEGNRLSWEIGLKGNQKNNSKKHSTSHNLFLCVAQKLAPNLGTTINVHHYIDRILIEMSLR